MRASGSGVGNPASPFPVIAVYTLRPSTRRCRKNAPSANASSTMPSVAARPWSSCAPTTEKKTSVDSTPKLPPSTIGLPKSAIDSMNVIRNAFARPGRINGSETSMNVRHRLARSVCAASSSDGATPSTTPISTRNAIGVNANTCATRTP